MSGGLEWAAQYEEKQNILKTTSRLQVNLKTWDDADITHFYQDLLIMFQDLKDDEIKYLKNIYKKSKCLGQS